jgi:probable rRNA maturation factor
LIDVEIEDAAWTDAVADVEKLARGAALAALDSHEAADEGVTILLTDDDSVAKLNLEFREKAGPTNVLSFPSAPNPERHLGDLALAYGVCAREAAEQGKSLAHHVMHLTVHGVLHLLGHDHIGDDEAEAMEDLERVVLARLGVPDPYSAA